MMMRVIQGRVRGRGRVDGWLGGVSAVYRRAFRVGPSIDQSALELRGYPLQTRVLLASKKQVRSEPYCLVSLPILS